MTTRGLAGTSRFIANESGRRLDQDRFPERMAVSVITYAELRAGVLAAADLTTRERRLVTLSLLADLDLIPIDTAVADAWAALRVRLRDSGRSMRVNDAWIAATAIAMGLPVVSQDRDFDDVPGLEVILV